jgi:hypothetical protein
VTIIRRVPTDFDWPLNQVWHGYVMPDRLLEAKCPDCESGYSPYAQHLHDRWYGKTDDFDPADTGSTPLRVDTPVVWAFAERNVTQAPEFYGRGPFAVAREAVRLIGMWNQQWCHHLSQVDVDALVDAGRLMDFTHRWSKERRRWEPLDPPVHPTAAEVNEWSLSGLGHDSLNCSVVVRARCEWDGQPLLCATCVGHATVEKYPGQRAEAEAWEPTEPPTGEGWQAWEDTSEGSPISPVFPDRAGLVGWFTTLASIYGARRRPLTTAEAEALVDAGSSIGSFVVDAEGRGMSGDEAVLAARETQGRAQ